MGEGQDAAQDAAQDRVTIQEAARRLGVKEDAIRKRIQRGSMRPEKAEDGRVYVRVDTTQNASQDKTQTTQDATQDKTQTTQDERLEDLREQVGYLRRQLDEEREARRRADTIIAQLARANEAQAHTIRELEAPSEAPPDERESPETVEKASDRAAPRSATGGAQEGTERPQARSGWRVPVEKLPWWHYVLGLIAVAVASGLVSTSWWTDVWFQPGFLRGLEPNELMRTIVGFEFPEWVVPGLFGFWVGLKRQHLSLWRNLLPVGVVVATIMLLVAIVVTWLTFGQGVGWWTTLVGIVILGFVPTLIFYVSGATIGRALQRRTAGKYASLTPHTEAAPSAPRSTTPGDSWSPRKQAILGFVGTVIAALISLVGTIFSVMASGG